MLLLCFVLVSFLSHFTFYLGFLSPFVYDSCFCVSFLFSVFFSCFFFYFLFSLSFCLCRFSDPEFSAPGHSCLWGLGALEEQHRECTGFLIMPKRPYEWRVDSHGCYKLDNAALGFGPRDQSAHLPVFLHLRTANLPGPSSIMRSEHAQQRRFERKHDKERMQRRRKRT